MDVPKALRKALKGELKKLPKDEIKPSSTVGLIGQLDAQVWPEESPDSWVQSGLKHGWYIRDINSYPTEQSAFEDLGRLIRGSVLPGHLPERPFLDDTQPVITLGSCFARELRLFLSLSGVMSTRFWIPSGLNNTFAILDFLAWTVEGRQTGRGFRYERSHEGDIREWTPEAEREAYAKAFAAAGAFVFTIGLAEVWQDRETGGVFWRGVPNEIFNADRHVFRLTTVDENTENLRQIIALIRKVNPAAPIVLTLSPVPLLATHREISCLTADCVSKSVLRVALDNVMSDRLPDVYYWPSFEIVKWVGANLPWSAYGGGGSSRDVNRVLVSEIIDAFIESFYTPAAIAAMQARRAAESSAG
jgi:hypothetical protein